MSKGATTTLMPDLEAAQLQQHKAVLELMQLPFLGRGPGTRQCPTAVQGGADLLESAPGPSLLTSIVWHTHSQSNTLQTTEEASPSAGNSAPSTQGPDECFKSKVILPPSILCILPNKAGRCLRKQPHIQGWTVPTSTFRLLENHTPTYLFFTTKSRGYYLREKKKYTFCFVLIKTDGSVIRFCLWT